ncbi:MAG: hypothetical protein IJX96_04980 [Clostridia bacterium]|nr:hypothetical protein [Clostridia bacterium]
MPTIDLQRTKFKFSVLPPKLFSRGHWVRTEISVDNEYVKYTEIGENVLRTELEEWIFAMFRLLAGAYAKEYSLSFERAGLAVDFYPHMVNGEEVSREERRRNDCVMVIRMLMRSSDKKRLLGGVYSFLLHREDIQTFASALREEFDAAFAKFERNKGKYLFIGVSPKGYKGCNYWYLDPTKTVKKGDHVWVRMGRRNVEQIVYVDCVKYCNDDTAPYDPNRVKRILRKATDGEI